MNAKIIGLIFVAVVVAYYIMSPYQICMRALGEYSEGLCLENTSW